MKTEDCACDIKSENLPLASLVVKSRSGDDASCNDIACNADGVMGYTSESTQGIPRLSTYHSDTNNHGSCGAVVEKSESQPTESETDHVFQEENIAVFIKSDRRAETKGTSNMETEDCACDIKSEHLPLACLVVQSTNGDVASCNDIACNDDGVMAHRSEITQGIPRLSTYHSDTNNHEAYGIVEKSETQQAEVNEVFQEENSAVFIKSERSPETQSDITFPKPSSVRNADHCSNEPTTNDFVKQECVEDDKTILLAYYVHEQGNNNFVPACCEDTNPPAVTYPPDNKIQTWTPNHSSNISKCDSAGEHDYNAKLFEVNGTHPIKTEANRSSKDTENGCATWDNWKGDNVGEIKTELPGGEWRDVMGLNKCLEERDVDCLVSTFVSEQVYDPITDHVTSTVRANNAASDPFDQVHDPITAHVSTTGRANHPVSSHPVNSDLANGVFTDHVSATRDIQPEVSVGVYAREVRGVQAIDDCLRNTKLQLVVLLQKLTILHTSPYNARMSQTTGLPTELCRKTHDKTPINKPPVNIQTETKDIKTYSCMLCTKVFVKFSALQEHYKNLHRSEKGYMCNICYKSYSQMSSLRTHTRTHTGEKPYSCDICLKSFNTVGNLKAHKRIHTGEKPYTCDICYKAFTGVGNLRTHIRTHTGEKPYTCDICSKIFTQLGSLTRHKRTHTGEKPYKCNVCSKAFTLANSLTRHKLTHTGENPYTCNICSKAFTNANRFTIHERTHTGEKPYTCNICSKAFTQATSLTLHKRTHTVGGGGETLHM